MAVSSLVVIAIVSVMEEHPRPHAQVRARWLPRPVVLPGIILGFGNVTYAAMSGFLILLLRERGHGTTWAFSAFAFAVLFGRAAFGGLPDRIGPRRSLYAGYAFLGVGLLAIALGRNPVLDLPAALLVGLGYSFPWPALATVVVARVPVYERAAALGALTAFYDLFVAGSSAVAGLVAGYFGFVSAFWLALASAGVAVAIVWATNVGRSEAPEDVAEDAGDAVFSGEHC